MAGSSLTYTTHTYHQYGSEPIKVDVVCNPETWTQSNDHKTLIFFHGGGLICGNRNIMFPDSVTDILLRRGWLIVTADYHLLPEGRVADIIEDVGYLEEWVLQEGTNFGIDLGKIAVGGGSAGCFVSVLALSTWKKLQPRSFLSLYGMLDLTNPWYSSSKGEDAMLGGFRTADYEEDNIRHFLEPGQAALWDDASAVTDLKSRVAYFLWLLKEGKIGPIIVASLKDAVGAENLVDLVRPSFPPTVAVHGIADSITPITDSRKLVQRLKDQGVRSHLIEVEGANHGLMPGEAFAADLENGVSLLEQIFVESST